VEGVTALHQRGVTAIPAAAIVGGAVIGAGSSLISGNKAAKAQKDAANQQIAYQREKDAQDRADLAPWRSTGASALARLAREYGLNGSTESGGPESGFVADPGYKFRLAEGNKAIERSAAARGLLGSGATLKAANNYAQDTASAEYGNYWNRLAGLAGVGQAATNTGIAAGQASTGNIMNAYQNMGNARASSYANTGSAINSGINNVLSAYLFQRGGGFGGGR
jgi:hypothetical protein